MNARDERAEPNPQDHRQIIMTNAVVHLWLAIEHLNEAGEHGPSADIRAIMEGLAEKHHLPVIEADAYANSVDET